jgi:hypothetical protein
MYASAHSMIIATSFHPDLLARHAARDLRDGRDGIGDRELFLKKMNYPRVGAELRTLLVHSQSQKCHSAYYMPIFFWRKKNAEKNKRWETTAHPHPHARPSPRPQHALDALHSMHKLLHKLLHKLRPCCMCLPPPLRRKSAKTPNIQPSLPATRSRSKPGPWPVVSKSSKSIALLALLEFCVGLLSEVNFLYIY